MIEIYGNDLKRAGIKVGWIDGIHIRNHEDKVVGYFEDNKIWDATGKKIAFIEGEYVYLEGSHDKIRIEDNLKFVSGGTVSDLCRATIRLLLG